VQGLRNYLGKRFGIKLNISIYFGGESALKKVDQDTSIVILDYFIPHENGNDIQENIEKINPKTQVIMLTSNEEIGIAIESFRKGAIDYVIKVEKSGKKISSTIYKIATYPIQIMVKEFRIPKYLAMFLLTFVAMGIGVYFILRFI
jgi:DNA-binding NtrC family response regulator